MASHWFLKEDHSKFRSCLQSIIDRAAGDLARADARGTLGDEHDQCQHLFVKLHALMQEREGELTDALLCCTKVPNPVVELRYYRSRTKRSGDRVSPQFIESETGADFALAIRVDLPSLLRTERSVLGQAKVMSDRAGPLNSRQLDQLVSVAGPESAAYLIWGEDYPPTVVTAENIASIVRTQSNMRLTDNVIALGKPLSEFFCDSFLGLWFGKGYDPDKEDEKPPETSIGVLYHYLHRGAPPPNVTYIGISDSRTMGVPPGVYVNDRVDIDSESGGRR